ncbi:MAG: hypothetical protein ACHQF4_11275 [Sphingobacteriales bacterium]
MSGSFLLQGTVKWSYSYELAEFTETAKIMHSMASFSPPLHRHNGNIALTDSELIIEGVDGDIDLTIQLNAMKQVYLGFDDLFPMTSARSFGAFWQPLRIEYYVSSSETEDIYLIIDYNGLFTHDKDWYNTLTQMFQ